MGWLKAWSAICSNTKPQDQSREGTQYENDIQITTQTPAVDSSHTGEKAGKESASKHCRGRLLIKW